VRVFRLQNDANTAQSLVQKIGGDILGDYFDFMGGTVELSGNGERIAIGATSVITREGYVNLKGSQISLSSWELQFLCQKMEKNLELVPLAFPLNLVEPNYSY
jgi:hypothetical protein